MRALFTCRPTVGHLYPLLPLAQAARDAGHEVAFASAPSTIAQARGFGFEGFPAGRETLSPDQRLAQFPELRGLERTSREWSFTRWFAGYESLERAPDLLAIGREWRCDLIVNDWAELAGPAVAAKLGIPSATAGLAVPRPDIAALVVPWIAPMWRSMGLDVPPYGGLFDGLFLDPCPPSMRPPRRPRTEHATNPARGWPAAALRRCRQACATATRPASPGHVRNDLRKQPCALQDGHRWGGILERLAERGRKPRS